MGKWETSSDDRPKVRFGLRGLFVLTSGVCVLLALAAFWPGMAIVWYPPLGGCGAIITGLAAVDGWARKRDAAADGAWGSWGLIAASLCLLLVMAACVWLPGGAGPVQTAAVSPTAEAVIQLRMVMMWLFLASPVAFGLVGLLRLGDGHKLRPLWTLGAIGLYGVTWFVLIENDWFLPTV